ncbi:hypothetical protein EIP91_008816 [Steccherinum ochraceum]|uniref:Uncharacterized protein n=1 Tax=Steccherinum ochraceum TaxID=92696 RepID=A0A4R0R2A9_9APHY|nr:hypothetical protein EIP91_008816 [Steccherinum ochraceum]
MLSECKGSGRLGLGLAAVYLPSLSFPRLLSLLPYHILASHYAVLISIIDGILTHLWHEDWGSAQQPYTFLRHPARYEPMVKIDIDTLLVVRIRAASPLLLDTPILSRPASRGFLGHQRPPPSRTSIQRFGGLAQVPLAGGEPLEKLLGLGRLELAGEPSREKGD